jgi:hypothetical protein
MARKLIVLVLIVAAVGGAFYWRHRARQAELKLGLDAATVLSARFAKSNALKVANLSGELVAPSEAPILGGMAQARQVTRAPYSVDYFVNLGGVDADAMRWDAKGRTLTVEVPDVTVAAPAIDYSRAEVQQQGLWISRATGQAMQRQGASRLAAKAEAEARKPDNIAKARANARDAVEQNVRAPLAAAGLGDITVTVRIAGVTPLGGSEPTDMSRSIAEVYRDFVD